MVFCTTYALILPAITLEREQPEQPQIDSTLPPVEALPLAAGDGPAQENLLPGDVAYIDALGMGQTDQGSDTPNKGITDGSAPWDDNDTDGCDKNQDNLRVRTFDIINYDFYYRTKLHDEHATDSYPAAYFCFEFLLPLDRSQAYFNVDAMPWLSGSNVYYRYEPDPVTINGTSYQVLHGSFLDQREGSTITAALASRNVSLRVLNMKNGSTIQPIFSMWMRVNNVGIDLVDGIPQSIAYGHGHCSTHGKDEVVSLQPEPVTVTCAPRYDISLKRGENASSSWAGDFNFSTGNENALDRNIGTWNGRMSAYGIRLMVKGVDKEHGLRGCAFPEPGDTLEFDITLVTAWQNSNGGDWQYVTQEFTPRVWSAEEFTSGAPQKDGRQVNSNGVPGYAAPLNKGGEIAVSCADGGTWTFRDDGYLPDNNNHRRIHVTVTGYTFDPARLPYANERDPGNPEFYNPDEVGDQFWNIEKAVFSTGEMWVLTPFYNQAGTDEAHYITKVKNTSSLTMWQSIFAQHISVKDKDNAQKFYDNWADYRYLDSSITLQNPGTFNATVYMVKPVNGWNIPLTDGCLENENELKDYATPGTYADLEAVIWNDGAEGDYVGVAYNLMAKFDNAFFEPVTWQESRPVGYPDHAPWDGFKHDLNVEEFDYVGHTWTVWPNYTKQPDYPTHPWGPWGPKMLYGTTKNKQGWDHKGQKPDGPGYDEEMMKATPDDLIWYDSMKDLKADGAVCVAVLMEYRNVGNDGNNPDATTMNHLHMTVHGKIKDTAEPGYVYAVSNYAAVWTKEDLKPVVGGPWQEETDGQIGTMHYLHYSQREFPSYSPSATGNKKMNSATFPKPTHERSWYRWTDGANTGYDGNNGYGTSTKSRVDADGTFHAGSGGNYFQDNVYVISYKSEVGIQVAQTDSNGTSKGTYSMDTSERVVDFKVSPRLIRNVTDAGAGGETTTQYADVTLTVTLPKGLEYYPGTAVWGGTYAQDGSFNAPGRVSGGQGLVTTSISNADGTVTLEWVLKRVPLSKATEDLAPIYFSCKIGNSEDLSQDVVNAQHLEVRADIYSTMDPGVVHGTTYNNQANTGITISKSSALTIIKTADQSLVNMGDSMGFTMKLYNGSESSYDGWIADILPLSGVGESAFSGNCRVEAFRIVSGVDVSNVKFYYSTNPEDGKATDVTDLNTAGTNWTEFHLDSNQTWCPGELADSITAIAYHYSIPAKTTIVMHIDLSLPQGKPGDIIHNHLLLNHLVSSDRSQIVGRTLEGLTWQDDNKNGIQDEADSMRLSGINATLMKLKEGAIFSTTDSADPILWLNRETTYQGLKAEDIKEVRVAASGPVGNIIQLYYSSTGSTGTPSNSAFDLLAGFDEEYHDFSQVSGANPCIIFKENPGEKTMNVLSQASYNNVSASLNIKYNNSNFYMHTQGIVLKFEDGKHLIVRYHNGDMTNGNIQYCNNAWDVCKASDSLFGNAGLNQWGEKPIYTLTDQETAAIKAGGLKLNVVLKDGKLYTLFNGKCVATYDLPADYANKKVRVGFFAWNTANNAVFHYAISDDTSAMLSEANSVRQTITPGTSEYVFDLTGKWSGDISALRLDPFNQANASGTVEYITLVLTDGTTRRFDLTVPGNYEKYLTLENCSYSGNCQLDNHDEANYYAVASIETGNRYNVRTRASEPYEQGRYKFTDLPSGTYAVKFESGTFPIYQWYASNPDLGSDDTLDSDGHAVYSDNMTLEKTVILGIELPSAEDMQTILYESKYHDSGFYSRGYELPKTGGAGTTPYTLGGALLLTGAVLLLLYKARKRGKEDFASS